MRRSVDGLGRAIDGRDRTARPRAWNGCGRAARSSRRDWWGASAEWRRRPRAASTSADRIAHARSTCKLRDRRAGIPPDAARARTCRMPRSRRAGPRRSWPAPRDPARAPARRRLLPFFLAAGEFPPLRAVGRIPSTCRVTSIVPSVRSSSSILRRNALGESPEALGGGAEAAVTYELQKRTNRFPIGRRRELKLDVFVLRTTPVRNRIAYGAPAIRHKLRKERKLWQPERAMTVHDRRTTAERTGPDRCAESRPSTLWKRPD